MEQKLKQIIGDYVVIIATLQAEVERLQEELKKHEDKSKRKTTD
jgi:hypothetical protein